MARTRKRGRKASLSRIVTTIGMGRFPTRRAPGVPHPGLSRMQLASGCGKEVNGSRLPGSREWHESTLLRNKPAARPVIWYWLSVV